MYAVPTLGLGFRAGTRLGRRACRCASHRACIGDRRYLHNRPGVVIYIVPGGQYPVIGIAPGPYPIPGDPTPVIRLDIEKAIRRALTPPSRPAPRLMQAAVPPPPQAAPLARASSAHGLSAFQIVHRRLKRRTDPERERHVPARNAASLRLEARPFFEGSPHAATSMARLCFSD